MDYIKISELPAAGSASGTDQLETNQGGTSRRITVNQLLSIGGGYLPLTGGTLTGKLTVNPASGDPLDVQIGGASKLRVDNFGTTILASSLYGYTADFSSDVVFPTQAPGTNNTKGATTAFVTAALAVGVAQSIMLSHSPGSITVPASAVTQFSWDTVDRNTTGGTYTAPNFTVPAGMGGVWDVQISCEVGHASAAMFGVNFMRNGAIALQAYHYAAPGGSTTLVSGKCVLAAGDIVRAEVNTVAGLYTMFCTSGTARQSWMHLTRVGA